MKIAEQTYLWRGRTFLISPGGITGSITRLESEQVINWIRRPKLFPLRTTGDGNCLMHSISMGINGHEDHQVRARGDLRAFFFFEIF